MASPETIPRADINTGEHSAFGQVAPFDVEAARLEHSVAPEQTAPRESWNLKRVGNKLFDLSMRLIYGDLRHLSDWYEGAAATSQPVVAPDHAPRPVAQNQQNHIPRQRRQPVNSDHSGVLQL